MNINLHKVTLAPLVLALKSEEVFLVLDKQFHLALIAFCVLDLLRMRIVAQEYMLPATHYLLLTLE